MFAANLRASWASSWQKTNIICSSCKCLQTVRCMRGDEAYRHLLHGKQVANSLRRKGNSEYSEKEIGMRPQRKENSEHSGKQIAISAYSVKGIANIVGRTANTGEKNSEYHDCHNMSIIHNRTRPLPLIRFTAPEAISAGLTFWTLLLRTSSPRSPWLVVNDTH